MAYEQGWKACLINLECERESGPGEMVQSWNQKYKMIATQKVRGRKLSKIDRGN